MQDIIRFGKLSSQLLHPTVISKEYLGGKGYGLVKMDDNGFNVPSGLIIPVEKFSQEIIQDHYERLSFDYSTKFFDSQINDFLQKLYLDIENNASNLTDKDGNPVLLSIRSGAPVSMPGMMDTILNVGINENNLDYWKERLGDKTAMDCLVRLTRSYIELCYSDVVDNEFFDDLENRVMSFKYGLKENPKTYSDFTVQHLEKLHSLQKKFMKKKPPHKKFNFFFTKEDGDFHDALFNSKHSWKNQVLLGIHLVYYSWFSERAVFYRNSNQLDHIKGTAVTIQSMVFGNKNEKSCSGVLFTRNPNTGEKEIMGEYLSGSQGEDVVSGFRSPRPISEMVDDPNFGVKVYNTLVEESIRCETIFEDMMDIEFTIEDGEVYFLQSRSGKRSEQANVIIGLDMIDEGIWAEDDERLNSASLDRLSLPKVIPNEGAKPILSGQPSSSGVVKGFLKTENISKSSNDIFIASHTSPDDINSMMKAKAVVTLRGGATSHAAVVCRGVNKTCVVGAQGEKTLSEILAVYHLQEVVVCGSTGNVWLASDVSIEKTGKLPNYLRKIFLDRLKDKACTFSISNPFFRSLNVIDDAQSDVFFTVRRGHLNLEKSTQKSIVSLLDGHNKANKPLLLDMRKVASDEDYLSTTIGQALQLDTSTASEKGGKKGKKAGLKAGLINNINDRDFGKI